MIPFFLLTPLFFGLSCLGFASGVIGSFLFLKRESMLADALSHAAFPGIVCSFLFFSHRSPLLLLFGGMVSGYIALYFFYFLTYKTRLKKETILGIILSSFFGFGLVLHSYIQKLQLPQQAVINKFLFGNAASMLFSEIITAIILSLCVIIFIFFMYRSYFLLIFDPIFAKHTGYSDLYYECVFSVLAMSMIALGLQVMGVILTGSLLIAPAAIARLHTKTQNSFIVIAGIFGSVTAFFGAMVSALFPLLPSGPVIVILLSIFLWGSIVLKKVWLRDVY